MRLVQQRYPDRNIVTAGRRAKAAFEAEQAEQRTTGLTSTAAAAAGKVWGEGEGQKVNMKEPPKVEVSQPKFVEVRDAQGEVVGRMSPASTSFPSSPPHPPSLPHPSHFLLSFSLNFSRAAAEHLLVLLSPSNAQWPNSPGREAQTKPSRVLLPLFLLRQRRRQQHAREGACLRLFRRDRVLLDVLSPVIVGILVSWRVGASKRGGKRKRHDDRGGESVNFSQGNACLVCSFVRF